jgi:hypothetical protein
MSTSNVTTVLLHVLRQRMPSIGTVPLYMQWKVCYASGFVKFVMLIIVAKICIVCFVIFHGVLLFFMYLYLYLVTALCSHMLSL